MLNFGNIEIQRRREHHSVSAPSRLTNHLKIILLGLALLLASADCYAQKKKKPAGKSEAQAIKALKASKTDLVDATKELKASLEKELPFLEGDVKRATEELEKVKQLLPLGIVSERDVKGKEEALATAKSKLELKRKDIASQETQIDNIIAEAKALDRVSRMPALRMGGYQATSALIRFNGPAHWVLADAAKVQSFFISQFHRALPVSAFGQTATHNHLGFDHSNSMDVAVHPDSAEGQALMSYLRSAGIPFIAFRQAVPGSATGAHIHVGYPSHRIR
ncbi:MAG TPA: hypothetical protein VJX74_02445 [Blastocatellia bacterium]|nr:hypothetical protein [Blastocatellia bacterium]